MIDLTRINDTFRQAGSSCVLASYAVAFNYFTELPCEGCFEAYCQHFKLLYSDCRDAEKKYIDHFHSEYDSRKCLGYEIVEELHKYSEVATFVKAREKFAVKLYRETEPCLEEIRKVLIAEEALINITTRDDNGLSHSVTAFYASGNGCMYKKDTNHDTLNSLSLLNKHNLKDSLLLTSIQPLCSIA